MATDQYLQIDGIKGESTDSKHKDWIEIQSYSQASAAAETGAASARKKTSGPGEIVITKPIDISSPKLYELCSSGKHINKVTIASKAAAGSEAETIEMSDVTISKVNPAIAPRDKATGVPTETITLNYGTIKWTYTQQK
jgi:type VI secretion system secreted protein Hcp